MATRTRQRVRVKAPSVRVPAAAAAVPARSASLLDGRAAWTAGDGVGNEVMANFFPSLGSADGDYLEDRDIIVARARDITRNSGWAAGALQREIDAVIGSRFRPLAKPDWVALGLDEGWAAEWKAASEALWRRDAEDPRCWLDAARGQTFSGLAGMAYRHYVLDGDALGVVRWMPSRPVATALRVTDPDLLQNEIGRQDGEYLRGGVEIDDDGAAVAYWFRGAHQDDTWPSQRRYDWQRIERETEWGRPVVLHHFDRQRDGQTRGVSRLAPIMEAFRMEGRYARTELQAAVLNALLGLFIVSPMDNQTVADMISESPDVIEGYQDLRAQYHNDKRITMAGVRIPHLFPGEDIKALATARPAAQFAEFEGAVLRQLATGYGQSYEQFSGDYARATYSSMRAALLEIWRGWGARRSSFAQNYCQPFYMAWLEEKVDAGLLPFPARAPDFREHWQSYARAKWIGPGKGFVDPVKEVQAAALKVAMGLSTLEDEAAELTGADFADNMAQIRREIAAMPDGMLHPAQESFAALIGNPDAAPAGDDRRPAA